MTTTIKKRTETKQRKLKTLLKGRVSEWGFQILTVENEFIAQAGNNPTDPDTNANLRPGYGAADIDTIESWAELKGKAIAERMGAVWCGIERKSLL